MNVLKLLKPKTLDDIIKDLKNNYKNYDSNVIKVIVDKMDTNEDLVLEIIKQSFFGKSDLKILLNKACIDGKVKIVKQIKKMIDPSYSNNFPIRISAYIGKYKVTKILINDKRVIKKLSKEQFNFYKHLSI